MREIHNERRVTFAIVSIIFLSGIFFGLNFTNTSNNFLIKTPQSTDGETVSEIQTYENQPKINLFRSSETTAVDTVPYTSFMEVETDSSIVLSC